MKKVLTFCSEHRVFGLIFGLTSLGLLLGGPSYIQKTFPPLSGSDLAMFEAVHTIMTFVGYTAGVVGIATYWIGVVGINGEVPESVAQSRKGR